MTGDRIRMIWGFVILAIIAGLAVLIGIHTIEQQTSFGLEPILIALTAGLASFCNWAFAREVKTPAPEEEEKKKL